MQTREPPSGAAARAAVAGETAAKAAGSDLADRRETDKALRFWSDHEKERERAGFKLDVALPDTWTHCFVLLPKPRVEQSVLLAYGRDFARSFGLPLKAVPPVPIAGKLPPRVAELLLRGGAEAPQQNAPVRAAGEIEYDDRRRELYRAVFIPVREGRRELRVFGSLNSRPQIAAPSSRPYPANGGGFWRRLKSRLSAKQP